MAYGVFQTTVASATTGIPIMGASVAVTVSATGLPAVIYADRDGMIELDNPTATDANGFVRFYVSAGRINVVATSGPDSASWADVLILADGIGSDWLTQVISPSSGVVDLSTDDSVRVWWVDLDQNVTSVILPSGTAPGVSFAITIVFSQPIGGGFIIDGWPTMNWEYGLTPVIDTTSLGITTVQVLFVDERDPLGVS